MLNSVYGLDKDVKSFAIANDFVVNTNKACYSLGQNLAPFCIFGGEHQKEYDVIDFATFGAFVDTDKSLLDEVIDYRRDAYVEYGISVNTDEEIKKKLLFYDYLLSISLCYVEVPKYVTRDGRPTHTYDKFFCTKNPKIMATWMGSDLSICQAKYSPKVQSNQFDFSENMIRFVKLNQTTKGNTISVPRTAFSVESMTCVPLYMIYAFIKGFEPHIQSGIVKFSYLKDNDTIRELATTLSEDILREYYDDIYFINATLQGVDINTNKQGGLEMSSKMHRGYIKVPELGASIYDGSGCRSLNVARLLKAEKVTEVDRTFIKVDLNSVKNNFFDGVEYIMKQNPEYVADIYRALLEKEPETDQPATLYSEMTEFVEGRSIILSTTFHRSLHMFMVNNPLWFPLYTGKPNNNATSSANYGVVPMDF